MRLSISSDELKDPGNSSTGVSSTVGRTPTFLRLSEPGDAFSATASLEVALSSGPVTVEIDLSGAIDVEAERKRLQKDLAAAEKELKQNEGKLSNQSFLDKAPAAVVEKVRARRDTALADIERIKARLDSLSSLGS